MNVVAFVKRNILLLAVAAGGMSLSIAVPCPLPEMAAGDTISASTTSAPTSTDDVRSPEKKHKKHKMNHNHKVICMDEDAAAAHAAQGDVDQGYCD